MKKISGNKLLVKALKEEGVDTIFGYPGACTIDISDELYKQDYTKVILPRQEEPEPDLRRPWRRLQVRACGEHHPRRICRQ